MVVMTLWQFSGNAKQRLDDTTVSSLHRYSSNPRKLMPEGIY